MTGGGGRTQTLDGLRGIAVLAVVIEHAWSGALPGGFAGVDIFFVLSGYLITGLLVRELRATGRISLSGFYARRVRRIIPASLVCAVGIWIGYTQLLGPALPDTLKTQALSATFSVSNIYFATLPTGYFDADPSTSPFLHYWSLGVEEQFYLVWPSILLALTFATRWVASRRDLPGDLRRWLPIGALGVLGLASLALALRSGEKAAFYLLPQRGWELIAGGLLVWVQQEGLVSLPAPIRRYRFRVLGVIAGAVLIGLVLVAAPDLGRWPGPATVLVVLGTTLLVAGGDGMPGARILTAPPLRFFGRISYALYLWHWPLIAGAALIVLPSTQTPDGVKLIAVLLAIGLATASTFVLEEPIRTSRLPMLQRRKAVGVALVSMSIVGSLVLTVTAPMSRILAGNDVLASALPGAINDRERLIADRCRSLNGPSGLITRCLYGSAARPDGSPSRGDPMGPVVVLFGDSHASMWFPAIDAWAKQQGLVLVPLIRAACAPVDASIAVGGATTRRCDEWKAAALARIEQLHPVVTLVGYSTGTRLIVNGKVFTPRGKPARWIAPAEAMLERLTAIGPVVLMGDAPRPKFPVPACLGVHRLDPSTCAKPLAELDPAKLVEAEQTVASASGALYANAGPYLCPGGVCTMLVNGRVGWVDEHHLSKSAVMAVLPSLEPTFDRALGLATRTASPSATP